MIVLAICCIIFGSIYNTHTGWYEGGSLLIAVFMIVLVGAMFDGNKDRKVRKIYTQLQMSQTCVVFRGKTT